MEGVRNVHPFTEEPKASQLQRKVQNMCGWRSKGFPGCQPVSMDRKNIELLTEMSYRYLFRFHTNNLYKHVNILLFGV